MLHYNGNFLLVDNLFWCEGKEKILHPLFKIISIHISFPKNQLTSLQVHNQSIQIIIELRWLWITRWSQNYPFAWLGWRGELMTSNIFFYKKTKLITYLHNKEKWHWSFASFLALSLPPPLQNCVIITEHVYSRDIRKHQKMLADLSAIFFHLKMFD